MSATGALRDDAAAHGRARAALEASALDVEARLEAIFARIEPPTGRLRAAMRHAVMEGGKRVRAHLARVCGRLAGARDDALIEIGCAIEALHAYSLAHDDLPAMDDAALRRGKPSCHRAFDEATAILAGDALQALAFELLADPANGLDGERRARLCVGLARAVGERGMCGGQMLDMIGEAAPFDADESARMEALKTGALIEFSARAGAIAGVDRALEEPLAAYARALGRAFQIKDDLLDATGESSALGKDAGADAAAGKSSAAAILGMTGAREAMLREADAAREALNGLGAEAEPLRDLVAFVVRRDK